MQKHYVVPATSSVESKLFNPPAPINVQPLARQDQARLDPTGKAYLKVMGYRKGSPTPKPSWLPFTRDQALSEYCARRNRVWNGLPAYVREWDDAYLTKYGAQGASFDLEEVLNGYIESYRLARRKLDTRALHFGRDLLIREIRLTMSHVGGLTYAPSKVLNTLSGLPVMGKKDEYHAYAACNPYRHHPEPNLPGQRDQRGKHRVINFDSQVNVEEIQPTLDAVRRWLVKWFPEYFDAWVNPVVFTQPAILSSLKRGFLSVETDYKKCDEHFGWPLVSDLILPIYEQFLDPMDFLRFAGYVEEMFRQPLYLGPVMWTGEHNAFSGQSVVSDFETLFNVILALTACVTVLPSSSWSLHTIGDDLTIFVKPRRRAGDDTAQRIYERVVALAGDAGMEISPYPKSLIRAGHSCFARRLYYPGLPKEYNVDGVEYVRGIYPGVLWLNSVCNPERRSATVADGIVATMQRCDNFYGCPWWAVSVEWLWSSIARADRQEYVHGTPQVDWWSRVYGEEWHLADSPTYRHLLRCGLLT